MYRRYVLYTLLVVFTCNFVDRQILSLLMEAIKHGKQGHAGVGTEHAKSAVMHMKEVH